MDVSFAVEKMKNFSDEKKRDALIPKKTMILQKKLKKILPEIDDEVEYAWTDPLAAVQQDYLLSAAFLI